MSRIPLEYFQGMTSDPRRALWFDGVFIGLYRADASLRERRRNDVVIPPEVTAREGYNHVGDLSWDAREGGRILLPLECFYPGRPGGANSCGTGSIGVADPRTLRWRYYVKLDPAEIPKAMWAEVSPDGRLLWTSAGADLLAYRTERRHARASAPGAAPIRAVRRLAGAAPTTGITGAAFYGDRLLLAGQDDTLFRVWSVDLATGARRLEIERTIVGESEGLDVVDALGGDASLDHHAVRSRRASPDLRAAGERAPALRRRGRRATGSAWRSARAGSSWAPGARHVHGHRARRAAAGVVVRFRGQLRRTSAAGVARFTVTLRRPGQLSRARDARRPAAGDGRGTCRRGRVVHAGRPADSEHLRGSGCVRG